MTTPNSYTRGMQSKTGAEDHQLHSNPSSFYASATSLFYQVNYDNAPPLQKLLDSFWRIKRRYVVNPRPRRKHTWLRHPSYTHVAPPARSWINTRTIYKAALVITVRYVLDIMSSYILLQNTKQLRFTNINFTNLLTLSLVWFHTCSIQNTG